MDISTGALFNLTAGTHINETLGKFHIRILPGNFSCMDKDFSTNNVHRHTFYELCYVVSGIGEFIHEEEHYLLETGDIFVANPGIKHEIRLLKNADGEFLSNLYLVFYMIEIIIDNKIDVPQNCSFEECILSDFLHNHSVYRKYCNHLLSYISFIDEYININKGSIQNLHHTIKGMAYDGMKALTETASKTATPENRREISFNLAIMFIETNLSRKLNVIDIATHIFTSERNLHYMFKEFMNKSVTTYINERKMAIAALYLKMNYKASDAGAIVGISDPTQFSRLFKRYYGKSPKKYQMTN